MRYTTEIMRVIWDDTTGESIEVGPDRDSLKLVEIRYRSDDGKLGNAMTFTPEQARLVAAVLIECVKEMEEE